MANVRARARRVSDALTPSEWARAGGMAATVIALNVAGWGLLAAALGGHYHITKTEIFGVGTGILAYTLGMRHAFDADHIAAIDNTTRKLMNDGQRPLGVGFFFSLGHSTVVFALALLFALGVRALAGQVQDDGSTLHSATGLIGTGVSGAFLYVIAGLNLVVLVGIVRVLRQMRSGTYSEDELEELLRSRGLMNRLLGRFTNAVTKTWQMYPLGVLFGLGFDTATEVALLVSAWLTILPTMSSAGSLPQSPNDRMSVTNEQISPSGRC
jgi:high-affinity nickel-transport protein